MFIKIKKTFSEPNHIVLSLILILAAVLRFYGLINQSMWLDELHTMNEIDPAISWSETYRYLSCCDPHPPLYYIIERMLVLIFGYTDFVARSFSAICGIISVWAMYLLGKEILSKPLGLMAALLTAVNYYNIYYSQEARCYIMALLFVVLSYLCFVRLVKKQNLKNSCAYGIFALSAIYSHYFSFFILISQALIALIFIIAEKENRLQTLKYFSISGAIVVLGYLPWIPVVLQFSKVQSFWIGTPNATFAATFFVEYFGSDHLSVILFVLLLLFYCFQVFNEPNTSIAGLKNNPLQLSFLIALAGIAITYMIPYVRSLVGVPMLFNRYTIVVVPLFLLAAAFSLALIHNRAIQIVIISLLVAFSMTDILIAKNYYGDEKVLKTQFREATAFIAEDKDVKYPIIEEKTAWHHRYYLKQFDYDVKVLSGSKEAIVDSILLKRANYDLDGFWIMGAHGFEAKLKPESRMNLDTAFSLIKEKDFYDAWVQLYVSRANTTALIPRYFPGQVATFYGVSAVAIWGGSIISQPVLLKKGEYVVNTECMGTKANQEYPHLTVYASEKKIGDFFTTENFISHKISLTITEDAEFTFRFDLDNDAMDPATGADRNVFLKSVMLEKKMIRQTK
jgi:hypothetical protein